MKILMKSASGSSGGGSATGAAVTSNGRAVIGLSFTVRLVATGSPAAVLASVAVPVGAPNSRRTIAKAAHINGAPTGAPGPLEVDEESSPSQDSTPVIPTVDGWTAGVVGVSAGAVSTTSAEDETLDTDIVGTDAPVPLEPADTSIGCTACGESSVELSDGDTPPVLLSEAAALDGTDPASKVAPP